MVNRSQRMKMAAAKKTIATTTVSANRITKVSIWRAVTRKRPATGSGAESQRGPNRRVAASHAIVAHLGRSRSAQCYLFNEADYTAAQRVAVEPSERFDEPEPIVACNEFGDVIRR